MTPTSTTEMSRTRDSGYKPTAIGTGKHPWPTMKRGTDDKGNRTFALGIIQSDTDPLWLQSARKYAEVMPELLRNMPVPGMLEAFEAVLNNPLVYLESDPGYGKSYLANLIGNAMHPQGAIIADAGGKNLETLLFETVFDSNANSDLIDRINSALRTGAMTEPSLNALRELKTGQGGEEKSLLSEEGNKKVFDWNGLKTAGIPREKVDSVLSSIQKYQEWNGGLRIGFKDVPGALIRAAMEHRPLVIDEFARRKPGTEAALQQVWQVVNGEIREMNVSLGNLGEFKLKHGDIPKVIMTSNKARDGADVYPISDSLESRLVKKEIPAFSEEDWAHRISQSLTGVPVTTLARLEKGHMGSGHNKEDAQWIVADSDKFRRNLDSIRTTGVVAVPPLQTTLLDHWQEVSDVSRALAKAYHKSAALLDPESPEMQRPDMGGIRYEIDKPGDKAQKLTPRTMLRELTQAIGRMAKSVPATETRGADFSDWSTPSVLPSKEPVEAKMGDRIKEVIERWIDDTAGVTVDGAKRPKLYEQLKRIWEQAGITGAESVLNGLNIGSKQVEATSEEAKAAKAIIDNLLKTKYPDFDGVSAQAVEAFLGSLQPRAPRAVGEEEVEAHVLSSNPTNIASASFTEPVIVASRTEDGTKPGGSGKVDEFFKLYPVDKLMDQDNVISTLALPYVSKDLLQGMSKLAHNSLRELEIGEKSYTKVTGISYADKEPIFITTSIGKTSVNGKDTQAKLHVIHNKEKGTTLVITDHPPSVKLPNDSPVTVIVQQAPNAHADVSRWLKQNEAGDGESLRLAFEFRNFVPKELQKELQNKDFATLLLSKGVNVYSPTMLNAQKTGRAKE